MTRMNQEQIGDLDRYLASQLPIEVRAYGGMSRFDFQTMAERLGIDYAASCWVTDIETDLEFRDDVFTVVDQVTARPLGERSPYPAPTFDDLPPLAPQFPLLGTPRAH